MQTPFAPPRGPELVAGELAGRPLRGAPKSKLRSIFAELPRFTMAELVESKAFENFVVGVIIINAITLGLETSAAAMSAIGPVLLAIDGLALGIFTLELAAKLWVYRFRMFAGGWNVFDLAIVAIAWLPAAGALSVLRALRILRVLRLVSLVPQMRAVVGALLQSLPGMGSIIAVLLLIFYIASVMTTKLFGEKFPEWFGTVGESMYTLFQIMTLESWSMGIVRPIMLEYPFAWVLFVPFVIVTSFAVLNLFIALIVNSMQSMHTVDRPSAAAEGDLVHYERDVLIQHVLKLHEEVRKIRRELDTRPRRHRPAFHQRRHRPD